MAKVLFERLVQVEGERMVTRREVIKRAGTLLGFSFFVSPVKAQPRRTVTMLHWSHFVPTFNPELERQVTAWAAQRGVAARVDFIAVRDIPARLAAEAASGTGHDIVQLILFDAAIFGELLEPVDDVVREVENRSGPWMPVARYVAQIGGRWLAVPWYHYSTPATINKRYWESIGLQPRHVARLSWEELFEAAQQLNKLGHPIAMTLGQTFDAQEGTHTLLYSYGARPVDESGRITIESDETAAALEYVKRLFPFMPREILGWDDASNNQFMLSGRGSWVHNGPSIWAVAKLQQLPIAELLDHVPMPRGPKGRYRLTRTLSLGIWKFSKNKDLAKELISHLLHPENFARQVEASMGYNQPLLSKLSSLPYWLRQSVLRYYEPPSEQVVVPGWPGPVGRGAQLAYTSFIIPIMFAKVATGELSVKEAMRWAAQELRVRYQQG